MKKLLLFLLVGLLFPSIGVYAADEYELVTSVADITPGAKYTISGLGKAKSDGSPMQYAIGAFGTKNYSAVTVSKTGTTITGADGVIQLEIETVADGYKIKNLSTGKYMVCTAAKTMKEDTSGTTVKISFDSSNNATVNFGSNGGDLRLNSVKGSNSLFSTYASGQTAIQLYKLKDAEVPDSRTKVTLSWSATNANATLGEDFTPPTVSYSPDNLDIAGLIQYSSSIPAVADFDANGQLQIKAAGTTVISATIPADNADYSSNTATYTLTVTEKPAPAVPGTWTLVESNSDIQVGARYIIVCSGNAVSTENNTNNRKITSVTVSGKTVVEPSASVMTFVLEQDGTDYLWKAENYLTTTGAPFGEAYLYSVTTNNNYLHCGNPQTANLNQRNSSISIATNGNATIKFVNSNNRVVRFNSTLFGAYTNTTGSLPQLYKFVEGEKEPQDYKPAFPAELSMRVGGVYSLDLGEPHPDVKFTVEGDAVSVSDAGVITATNSGTATITASWDANDDWNAGTASIAVTVKEALKDPGLRFRHEDVVGKLGVGIAAQAVYHESDGEITYSSSDETVVKVNPRTGMITPADVLKVGTAVITASIAETEEYAAGTKSYNVRIETPEVGDMAPAGDVTYDFTKSEKEGVYGMYPFSSNNCEVTASSGSGKVQVYEQTRDKMSDNNGAQAVTSINSGVVTLTFGEGSNYRYWLHTDGNHLRFYASAEMTFSVPEGYSIEKITVNTVKTGNASSLSVNVGEWNAKDATWTATDENTTSVKFTNVATSSYVQIPTMTVVLKKVESNRTLADLKFEQRVYNTFVDVDTEINAVTHAEGVEENNIAYSIDNLDGDAYMIEKNDNGTIRVNVNTPGVYTLRAKSGATETLLPGVAILRLNVFPVLDVNATNINEEGALESGEGYKLLAPGGGMVSFGEVPSTLVIRYSANEGEETLHDGADIEVTEDVTYKYWMEYAETYNSAEQTLHVVVRPGVPVLNQETTTYTFKTVDPTHTLYYIIDETGAKRTAAVDANLDGWTSANSSTYTYTLPEGMTDEQNVRVYTKAVKEHAAVGKVDSDTAGFILYGNGTTTAIDTIGADSNNSVTEYFTLQGVRVARPASGNIYIVRRGTEVSKALVK